MCKENSTTNKVSQRSLLDTQIEKSITKSEINPHNDISDHQSHHAYRSATINVFRHLKHLEASNIEGPDTSQLVRNCGIYWMVNEIIGAPWKRKRVQQLIIRDFWSADFFIFKGASLSDNF